MLTKTIGLVSLFNGIQLFLKNQNDLVWFLCLMAYQLFLKNQTSFTSN